MSCSSLCVIYLIFPWAHWVHSQILENRVTLKPVQGDLCSLAHYIATINSLKKLRPLILNFFMCPVFLKATFIDYIGIQQNTCMGMSYNINGGKNWEKIDFIHLWKKI